MYFLYSVFVFFMEFLLFYPGTHYYFLWQHINQTHLAARDKTKD